MAAARVEGGEGDDRERGGDDRAEGEEELAQGKGEKRGRISLRLFFLDCNDYIAPLLIVLGRLVS